MGDEKPKEHEEKKSSKKFNMKKLSKHAWIIISVILAIALLIVLISHSNKTISREKAGEIVTNFIKNNTGETAQILAVGGNGSLYEVDVNFRGQKIPVYITNDGKYLVSGIIPISTEIPAETTATEQKVQEITKSDKPVVEAFVMSHCPYGTQIEKGLIPVMELLGNKVDFKLKFVSYAMHGETEINEELNQYCIQKEQNDKFLEYLKCFLKEGNTESCITETKMNKTKLTQCLKETEKQFNVLADFEKFKASGSNGYPSFNIHKLENDKYGIRGSPSLVINGQQVNSGRDSASILSVICSAFNSEPNECKTKLSSESPSPGFGYSASSTSTSTEGCGA